MANLNVLTKLQACIDDYLVRTGKQQINEMEANSELARQGLMADDEKQPGEPLRQLLAMLRDTNLLPRNIRQNLGSWRIRNSHAFQTRQQIAFFF